MKSSGGLSDSLHADSHYLFSSRWGASKQIKKFLADKAFEVINWPGNSPDLNRIKNCWSYMKEKLKNKDTGSIEKLIKAIKVLWTTDMSRTYLKNLSESMPRRI